MISLMASVTVPTHPDASSPTYTLSQLTTGDATACLRGQRHCPSHQHGDPYCQQYARKYLNTVARLCFPRDLGTLLVSIF